MVRFAPKAHDTGRGRHPDLNDDGVPIYDVWTTPDADERDFNRQMLDPTQHAHFMAQVAAAQSAEHPRVQELVAGQGFGGTPAQGYRAYQQQLAQYRQWTAQNEGAQVFVSDSDVSRMSLEEYEALFDANGRPRPGVLHYRNRSITVNDRIDRASERELRNG